MVLFWNKFNLRNCKKLFQVIHRDSITLFNFNSIYGEVIDNRNSTVLTEFKNDFENVYTKLGLYSFLKCLKQLLFDAIF